MKTLRWDDPRFRPAYRKVVNRLDLGGGTVDETVRAILQAVEKRGDRAVIDYTAQFDRLTLTPRRLRVERDEIEAAYDGADPKVVKSLRYAAKRITAFHERQRQEGWSVRKNGVYLAQRVHPIERVGLYVPGGMAFIKTEEG